MALMATIRDRSREGSKAKLAPSVAGGLIDVPHDRAAPHGRGALPTRRHGGREDGEAHGDDEQHEAAADEGDRVEPNPGVDLGSTCQTRGNSGENAVARHDRAERTGECDREQDDRPPPHDLGRVAPMAASAGLVDPSPPTWRARAWETTSIDAIAATRAAICRAPTSSATDRSTRVRTGLSTSCTARG